MAVEQSGRPDAATRHEAPRPRGRRRKAPWSLVIAAVAIAGAVLYLVLANTGASAEYYMTIGELRACHSCGQRVVRVAGIVAPNSIVKNDQTQVMHFTITESALSMPVVYGGTVPDIFRAGVQVVVEGRLNSSGVFQAQNLLAKCPSKFQSATPASGQ